MSDCVEKNLMYVAGILVVIIVAAFILLSGFASAPTATTTVTQNLTTVSVAPVTTTIVKNLTTATGPNLATCNGYEYSLSKPFYGITGSCGWRASLVNITIYGGAFYNTTIAFVEQNTTNAPVNFTASVAPCQSSDVQPFYLPTGNYKVSFRTGASDSAVSCGNATMRISIS